MALIITRPDVTPLYKPCRYAPPQRQRVQFSRRVSPKTGRDLTHFGLELGMVFDRTTCVYERICRFKFQMNTKEKRVICEFKMDLCFFWRSNVSVIA